MKMVLSTLSLFMFSVFSSAAQTEPSSNPEKELEFLKEATVMAIKDSRLTCKIDSTGSPAPWADGKSDLEGLEDLVTTAHAVLVNQDRTQPVLVFKAATQTKSLTTKITTSEDFKQISRVQIERAQYITKRVNKGTIPDPNIVEVAAWTVDIAVTCQ